MSFFSEGFGYNYCFGQPWVSWEASVDQVVVWGMRIFTDTGQVPVSLAVLWGGSWFSALDPFFWTSSSSLWWATSLSFCFLGAGSSYYEVPVGPRFLAQESELWPFTPYQNPTSFCPMLWSWLEHWLGSPGTWSWVLNYLPAMGPQVSHTFSRVSVNANNGHGLPTMGWGLSETLGWAFSAFPVIRFL